MLNSVHRTPQSLAWAQPDYETAAIGGKPVYFALLDESVGVGRNICSARAVSRAFLSQQLEAAAALPCDLPEDVRALSAWLEEGAQRAGRLYRAYLDERKAGAPRRYFSNKSHALYFLKSVAPTKLVDGAWLYGLLPQWNDVRFASLIRIYLEELGEGVAEKNHVALYRTLLESYGCDDWQVLPDDRFVQGAIQLALAHHAADFLPEVIGFNLGYEQLPLHLLITAYELDELGIDPYYFTLHVTIDNAASGHARKSVQGVLDALPREAQMSEAFYQRVANGYKLNMLGVDTPSIIKSFDLAQEVAATLAGKAAIGSQLHSDYCRVAGRTVNDWLGDPAQLPTFLDSLEQMGWIKRNQDPEESRFWKLIHGERAKMYGVFTAYEQQLIYDWIAGRGRKDGELVTETRPSAVAFTRRRRKVQAAALDANRRRATATFDARGVIRGRVSHPAPADDFTAELRLLEAQLAALSSKDEMMAALIRLMSPAAHHTAAGLMATRIFTRLFGRRPETPVA